MRLILHVGHPKCGSTTVQSLLWNNRDGLAQQGIGLLGNSFRLAQEDEHWDWPLWYVNEATTDQALGHRLVERDAELAQRGIHTLVLSAENLSDPAKLAKLVPAIEHYDTSALYYIRRQDEFLVSSWRQWAMKRGIGLHHHILRRIAEGKPEYRTIIENLVALLGKEKVHVAFLEDAFLHGGNLSADVWHAIGLPAVPQKGPDAFNPSPDRASLLFLALNPHLFQNEHDDAAAQLMLAAEVEPRRRLGVDRHVQRSLKLLFDDENDDLARTYMAGRSGRDVIKLDGPLVSDLALSADDIRRLKEMLPRISDPKLCAALQNL